MDLLAFEIFSHLPAKSIFKFSTVSKLCHENLSCKLFANKQCKNLEGTEDSCFFIQPEYCGNDSPVSPQLGFLCKTFKSFCGFPPASIEFLLTTGSIHASYNGLLCCKYVRQDEYPLFLCNPVTKTWLPIIKPTSDYNKMHGFDFVLVGNVGCNQEDDYILMYAVPSANWASITRVCKIYSPRMKVWEEHGEMVTGGRSIDFGSTAYLKNGGGTIYFMSDCFGYLTKNSPFYWPYIVSYSIRNSISKFLKIPRPARKGVFVDRSCRFGVFKFKYPKTGKESICLIKSMKLVFSIWVLTDADLNTWKMILKARSKAMGILFDDSKPTISGFTVMNGNLLMIATGDHQVYKYTLTDDRIWSSTDVKRAEKIGRHQIAKGASVGFHSYSNTLRPCGDDAVPFPPSTEPRWGQREYSRRRQRGYSRRRKRGYLRFIEHM